MTFFNTRHPVLNMALERAYHQRGSDGQGSLRELSDAIDAVVALLDDATSASHGQAPAQAAPADIEVLEVLRAFAEGRINHLNQGLCPDIVAGNNSRDPDCRVCQALDGAAPAAVAGPGDEAHVLLGEIEDWMNDLRQANFAGYVPQNVFSEAGDFVERIEQIRDSAAPTTQPAPRQEAQEPVGSVRYTERRAVVDWYGLTPQSGAKLYTAPQPSPASQGDVLDAARYRWLRNSTEWEPFDSAWLNKHDIYGCPTPAMDAAIDAARAAQEGK